jgi:hypothetical protein
MTHAEYLELLDDLETQRRHVSDLASELDEERRKLERLRYAAHDYTERLRDTVKVNHR